MNRYLVASLSVSSLSFAVSLLPERLHWPRRRRSVPLNVVTRMALVTDDWFLGAPVSGDEMFLLPRQLERAFREQHGCAVAIAHTRSVETKQPLLTDQPDLVILAVGMDAIAQTLLEAVQRSEARQGQPLRPAYDELVQGYRDTVTDACRVIRSQYPDASPVIIGPFPPAKDPLPGLEEIWDTCLTILSSCARLSRETADAAHGRAVVFAPDWETLRTPVSWLQMGIPSLAPAGTYYLAEAIAASSRPAQPRQRTVI